MKDYSLNKELDVAKKRAQLERKKTNQSKTLFIEEIKNGLGELIEKELTTEPLEDKPKKENKIKAFFKKLFNAF